MLQSRPVQRGPANKIQEGVLVDRQLISNARKNSARGTFTDIGMARDCASMLQHMTGDKCIVVSNSVCSHYILRTDASGKTGRG